MLRVEIRIAFVALPWYAFVLFTYLPLVRRISQRFRITNHSGSEDNLRVTQKVHKHMSDLLFNRCIWEHETQMHSFPYLSVNSSFMRTKTATNKFRSILQVKCCKRRWRFGIITTLSTHQSAQRWHLLCGRRSRCPVEKRSSSAAATGDRSEHRRHGLMMKM